MKRFCVALLAFAFSHAVLQAAELTGRVVQASAGSADVRLDSDLVPNPGDAAKIFFTLPGSEDEVLVGSGTVTAVEGSTARVKLDDTGVTPQKDQLARVTSSSPKPKSAASAPPVATATPVPSVASSPPRDVAKSSPALSTPEAGSLPSSSGASSTGAATSIDFSSVELEKAVTAGHFAAYGISSVSWSGGRLVVQEAEDNMVMPRGKTRVLNIRSNFDNNPQTSLMFEFEKPISKFTMTRIGGNPASLPSWRLEGIDLNGKVTQAFNDHRGGSGEPRISEPREFSLEVSPKTPMKAVRLKTDNRQGSGTWATFNSLPLVQIAWEPAASQASAPTAEKSTSTDYRSLLIGDWKGARHVNRFAADGTFYMANPDDPVYPLGTWRIEGDKLIRKYNDQAERADTIVTLSKSQRVVRAAKGVVYKSTRVSR